MIRIFLVLLSVLVAVLAFVFDQPWLYGAAAVPLVGALGLLGQHLWSAYQRQHEPAQSPSSPSENASLEELGIMDVRPQEREGGNDGASGAAPTKPDASTSSSTDSAGAGEKEIPDSPEAASEQAVADAATAAQTEPKTTTPAPTTDQPILGPYLESLRAAIGAETVCLLLQEEVVLEYSIEAIASVHSDVQRSGIFETQAPLLTATMSRQPVTVRAMEDEARADLGYYDTSPPITQIALAPVAEPDAPATVFLLADGTAETDFGASEVRTLIERFADTMSLLHEAEEAASRSDAEPTSEAPSPDGPPPEPPTAQSEASDKPRPRREIIAEEMEAADAGDDDLALVLVHLNRAESIARRGDEAVGKAERLLETRLEHFAPGQRVERFGELTYGLFPRRDVEAVEGWATDLQDTLAQETGELEGGVSVGVAVRTARHEPEDLRADATEALREAYETGTCTIVA